MFVFERERERGRGHVHKQGKGWERAGQKADSREPDVGLKLTNCEIMNPLTDWATQAPLDGLDFV